MTAPANTVKDGELWLRCPECGDSQHDLSKAHFSVKLASGVYHCLRCNTSGVLAPKQFLSILSFVGEEGTDIELPTTDDIELPEILPGAALTRFSALKRGHVTLSFKNTPVTWDAFEMRDPRDGAIEGVMLRRPGKSMALGDRGLGWVGSSLPPSSPANPLRLVEGPYDVLSDRDVAVFGVISKGKLLDLKAHFVVLCPDGDVWEKPGLRYHFLKLVREALDHPSRFPVIMGIEVLPNGLDPDQVPEYSERTVFHHEELGRFLTLSTSSRKERLFYALTSI